MKGPKRILEKELTAIEHIVANLTHENDELNQKLMELLSLEQEFGIAAKTPNGRNVTEYIKKKLAEISTETEITRAKMSENIEKINAQQPEIQNFKFALRAIDQVRV